MSEAQSIAIIAAIGSAIPTMLATVVMWWKTRDDVRGVRSLVDGRMTKVTRKLDKALSEVSFWRGQYGRRRKGDAPKKLPRKTANRQRQHVGR